VSVVENSKPDKHNGLMQRSLEGVYFKGFAPTPFVFKKMTWLKKGLTSGRAPQL
jgi:hypothetical protein